MKHIPVRCAKCGTSAERFEITHCYERDAIVVTVSCHGDEQTQYMPMKFMIDGWQLKEILAFQEPNQLETKK
jgi:hypothetical protein